MTAVTGTAFCTFAVRSASNPPSPMSTALVAILVIVSAEPPRHFDRAVIDGVKDWKYAAEGEKYVAEIEVIFVMKELKNYLKD